MVVRRTTKRTSRQTAAPEPAAKRHPAAAPAQRRANDVTAWASKAPTEYHKAFARWIVSEVGFDPDGSSGKRAAFLRGVSIATAARAAFTDSDFLAEWREKTGAAKPGRKPATDAPAPVKRKPVPVVEDDDFDDDGEDDADDDFDDDGEDDDTDADDDDDDDTDEFDDDGTDGEDDDDVPPPPVKRGRGRPAKVAASAPAPKRGRPAKKVPAAPARGTRRTTKAVTTKPVAPDDDDFIIF